MNEEREITTKSLLESLIEKSPLGAVLITVAFNFFLICKEIFGEPKNSVKLSFYAASVIIGTIIFLIALIILHFYENKTNKKYIFRIFKEEDEYDIQENKNGKLIVECTQNFKIMAIKENINVFRLFHPIQGFNPIEFEFPDGEPKLLNSEELKKYPDGVEVYFQNRGFMKNKPEVIKVKWTYEKEKFPDEKALKAAFIRRPTNHLEISVVLPSGIPKPNKYGWSMYNTEIYEVKGGITNCRKYGDRFCLYKSFKKTKEGFSYAIWWESKTENS
jgi:hypothetical protein